VASERVIGVLVVGSERGVLVGAGVALALDELVDGVAVGMVSSSAGAGPA
jgi:hypothetical protein